MAKRHKPEEIVAKLRQVDVLTSQGQTVVDAVRAIGVTEVTYYRWRQEYGGLKTNQMRRMKALELENQRLRKADISPRGARGGRQKPWAAPRATKPAQSAATRSATRARRRPDCWTMESLPSRNL